MTPRSLRFGGSSVKGVKVALNGAWVDVWSALTATIAGGSVAFNLGNKSTPTTRAMAVGCSVAASAGGQPVNYQWSITGTSAGVTAVTLSSANASGVTVNATARLNQGGTVNLQCVLSSNGTSLVLSTSASFNYSNTV